MTRKELNQLYLKLGRAQVGFDRAQEATNQRYYSTLVKTAQIELSRVEFEVDRAEQELGETYDPTNGGWVRL